MSENNEIYTSIDTHIYQKPNLKGRIPINLNNFDSGFDCTFFLSKYRAEELMRYLAEELAFDFVGDFDASDAD